MGGRLPTGVVQNGAAADEHYVSGWNSKSPLSNSVHGCCARLLGVKYNEDGFCALVAIVSDKTVIELNRTGHPPLCLC